MTEHVFVEPTLENAALADSINRRLDAESIMVAAKSTLVKLLGAGGMLALTGAGVGAGLYGYSYLHDARNTAERLAEAIGKAVEKVTVAGEVKVAPDQSVRLADGATVDLKDNTVKLDASGARVTLDANGATVKLDPNSRVGVQGEGPRPTPEQLRPDTRPYGNPAAKVVTNFTVFKSVKWGQGEVHTGWKYLSNEQQSPSEQYCYFVQTMSVKDMNVDVKVNLASNGRLTPQTQNQPIDVVQAAQQCVWFQSAMTDPDLNKTGTGTVY